LRPVASPRRCAPASGRGAVRRTRTQGQTHHPRTAARARHPRRDPPADAVAVSDIAQLAHRLHAFHSQRRPMSLHVRDGAPRPGANVEHRFRIGITQGKSAMLKGKKCRNERKATTAEGSQQRHTGGPICQANHAAPKPGLNIRPVTRNRRWAALDRDKSFEIPIRRPHTRFERYRPLASVPGAYGSERKDEIQLRRLPSV
jgi:hypothetical protein